MLSVRVPLQWSGMRAWGQQNDDHHFPDRVDNLTPRPDALLPDRPARTHDLSSPQHETTLIITTQRAAICCNSHTSRCTACAAHAIL